ncbi:hypothetical protein GGR57DRAFT_263403 [Xylariaceae sp. FL1272]|nr:hypothetical protein GGR57DRAFT_263403 [Xylariaceae sp. FL1272]
MLPTVEKILRIQGFIPSSRIEEHTSRFFNDIGLDSAYFADETAGVIATQITSLFAAKLAAGQTTPVAHDGNYEWHIEGTVKEQIIEALADTGASINAISADTAASMNLETEMSSKPQRIRLPSGDTRFTLGTTLVNFSFINEETVEPIRCHVLPSLNHKLILGYNFLRRTRTLSQFKHRLKEVLYSGLKRLSLRLLHDDELDDEGRARVHGLIEGVPLLAVPDSGSNIMAMSSSLARKLGLPINRRKRTEIEFADGSTATTLGVVNARWQFPQWGYMGPDDYFNPSTEYEWHVIDGLTADVILGIDFIKTHDVFDRYEYTLTDADSATASEIYGIYATSEYLEQSPCDDTLANQVRGDLHSSEPFSFATQNRESVRRNMVNRRLQSMPLEKRESRQFIEDERIRLWDQMAEEFYRTGPRGNWLSLRDDYIRRFCAGGIQPPRERTIPQLVKSPPRMFWRWRRRRVES